MLLLSNLLGLVVFANGIFASSTEALIHKFQAGFDGFQPQAGLVADSAGNLYGTTFYGGGSAGAGTVSYHNLLLGLSPWGGLAIDRAGNLYGTAWLGGTCGDCGLVFELSPTPTGKWRFQVIHNFQVDGFDGINPQADLTIDRLGNLFGTTASGGTGQCFGGCGTVFELSRVHNSWQAKILHSFPAHGSGDGASGGGSAGPTARRHRGFHRTRTRHRNPRRAPRRGWSR